MERKAEETKTGVPFLREQGFCHHQVGQTETCSWPQLWVTPTLLCSHAASLIKADEEMGGREAQLRGPAWACHTQTWQPCILPSSPQLSWLADSGISHGVLKAMEAHAYPQRF